LGNRNEQFGILSFTTISSHISRKLERIENYLLLWLNVISFHLFNFKCIRIPTNVKF